MYTYKELLDLIDKKTENFEKWIKTANKMPLQQLKKESFECFWEGVETRTSDLYSKDEQGNFETTHFAAALLHQYLQFRNASTTLFVYANRLEQDLAASRKTKHQNKFEKIFG